VYTRTIIEEDISAVRISTHFYNTAAEVSLLIDSLSRIAATEAVAVA